MREKSEKVLVVVRYDPGVNSNEINLGLSTVRRLGGYRHVWIHVQTHVLTYVSQRLDYFGLTILMF